jgi:hypothetical protein
MHTSSVVIETEIADLRDVSLTALVHGHDSDAVLNRAAGETAVHDERASRIFNSSLPYGD